MGTKNNHFTKKTKIQSVDFHSSKYLNLPDLQFFNWCNQIYGINRGVYNTIDQWLFDFGMISIYSRRINLLAFLDSIGQDSQEKERHKLIRFGPGGLTSRLNEFVNQLSGSGKVIPLIKRS
ncbi:hypothetical protein [Bacillus marasmi]|uniref:hypothetical protein n=1 Tax=Bacillus marasmi TaxID=1926279 RepID=UPI0011C817A8|nr:hypothetical protein [Bacillus marasmi]